MEGPPAFTLSDALTGMGCVCGPTLLQANALAWQFSVLWVKARCPPYGPTAVMCQALVKLGLEFFSSTLHCLQAIPVTWGKLCADFRCLSKSCALQLHTQPQTAGHRMHTQPSVA